jgi:hypothetical protein
MTSRTRYSQVMTLLVLRIRRHQPLERKQIVRYMVLGMLSAHNGVVPICRTTNHRRHNW